MTVVHTYFYIVVDTQRGCRTLKKMKPTFKGDSGAQGLSNRAIRLMVFR